jgi:hypothetical protein
VSVAFIFSVKLNQLTSYEWRGGMEGNICLAVFMKKLHQLLTLSLSVLWLVCQLCNTL